MAGGGLRTRFLMIRPDSVDVPPKIAESGGISRSAVSARMPAAAGAEDGVYRSADQLPTICDQRVFVSGNSSVNDEECHCGTVPPFEGMCDNNDFAQHCMTNSGSDARERLLTNKAGQRFAAFPHTI